MRVVLAILGAAAGVAIAVFYLGNVLARLFVESQSQASPDDVAASHSLAWLATVFLSLVLGWFLGWWIGGLASGRKD